MTSVLDGALGGPLGRRAFPSEHPGVVARWAFVAATVAWALLMLRQWPCIDDPSLQYPALCYSDITALWGVRGTDEGLIPYREADVEYPVLTGLFIHGVRVLTGLLPGEVDWLPYFGLNSVLLFGIFLLLVAVHLQLGRGWEALMVAASPLVVADGLINWDVLPVALTSAAVLAWLRGRPVLSGVLIGLGTAAKLYPALLLAPIVLIGLRERRWRPALEAVVGAAASWLAVNLPVYLVAPEGWWYFFTFNADRGPDLGSVWFALDGLGIPLPESLTLPMALLMAVGLLVLAALAFLAPRTPSLAQLSFLVVLLFCLVNKVYSPQYALWLLPLLVLARRSWRDWAVFTLSELVYWVAVWGYLGEALFAGDDVPRVYFAAILLRVAVQLWLGGLVIRDILAGVRPGEGSDATREGSRA